MGERMKCLICNHTFIVKRRIKDLFSYSKYFVCDSCYKKYPIKINYSVVPLNKYSLKIYSLFDKEYYFKNDPFFLEFSHLLDYVLKSSNENIFIYSLLKLNEYNLSILSNLANLLESDLIIVCDYCKMPY